MNKLISIFVSFQILFLPFSTFAQDKVATVQKGEPAPFSGTIFSISAAAKLVTDLEFRKETCEVEKTRALDLQKSSYDLRISNLNSSLTFCKDTKLNIIKIKNDQIDFLQKEIAENGSTWPRVWLFVGGIIAGSLMTIGTAYAISGTVN